MRDIIFRGKYEGRWLEGWLVEMWGETHIICKDNEDEAYPVDEDTVGQYTGVKDKNGTKIFEDDILRFDIRDEVEESRVDVCYMKVEYLHHEVYGCGFILTDPEFGGQDVLDLFNRRECAVAGNIFDNRELLEGKYEN